MFWKWKKRAESLYQILDDISTVADMAKGDREYYFQMTQKMIAKRNDIARSEDGYTLKWK